MIRECGVSSNCDHCYTVYGYCPVNTSAYELRKLYQAGKIKEPYASQLEVWVKEW